jgi:hypothetical protein
MKPTQLFLLILILSICFSCRDNKVVIEESRDITYIYLDFCTTINNKAKHRFLKLETTENCLIAEIKRMNFDDNKIFIKDSNDKIFVFDEQGKFLNTVGQIGPGPDEHLSIYDFYLDKENKRICIFDMYKSAIFSYTYAGRLLEKKQVNNNIFKYFSHLFLVETHTLLLIKNNFTESLYNFSLVSGKNFDQVDNFVPYLFIGERWPQSKGYLIVTESKNQIFMPAVISDTIYRYDPNTKRIVPDMVFVGKCRPMTKKDVEGKTLEIAMDALQTAREKKLSSGISKITMTQKYLTFCSQDYNSLRRIIWNMETKKGYTQPSIRSIEDYALSKNLLSYLVSSTDDAFVCVIPAEDFIMDDWKENETAKEVAENTLEDDNPILVYYYIEE